MGWLQRLLGRKAGPSPQPDFSGELPSEPVEIARAFVADYERWNAYAWSFHSSDPIYASDPAIGQSYDGLISHYCGPEKRPQLPAFGSVSTFSPDNCKVVGEAGEGERRTVSITARDTSGFDAAFEFDFVHDGNRWRIEEVYYLDEYEDFARLRYL